MLVSLWLSGRILDWNFSQLGFDPSFRNLACLATLKSSDRTKQVCLWMTIYIYIYFFEDSLALSFWTMRKSSSKYSCRCKIYNANVYICIYKLMISLFYICFHVSIKPFYLFISINMSIYLTIDLSTTFFDGK